MKTIKFRIGVGAFALFLVSGVYWRITGPSTRDAGSDSGDSGYISKRIEREKEEIAKTAREWDETVWAEEVLAQEYEDTFVKLWDDLRASGDKIEALKSFETDELVIGAASSTEMRSHGISVTTFGKPPQALSPDGRRSWLENMNALGFRLVQSEWHHRKFERSRDDNRVRSTVYVSLHVVREGTDERFIVSGDLAVDWDDKKGADGLYLVKRIDATGLSAARRSGPPVFVEITGEGKRIPSIKMGNDPIITIDLDGDGLSELILPEQNVVYRNQGGGMLIPETLCDLPSFDPGGAVKQVGAAVVADFNGDGALDLLVAGNEIKVVLHEGTVDGRFPEAGTVVFDPKYLMNFPSAITTGDVDGDGRLDMWLAQIKPAYGLGTMPSPYYDANDGFLSFLLLNKGGGRFVDGTVESGLEEKRYRRTFSSSFVDLDDDCDLDLMVVSDFAGLDLHENDGSGHFRDVTREWVDEKSNFGMGHTLGDYNRDGKLDFYVTGMSSTTARRLEYLDAGVEDRPEIRENRMRMGYGSRMYMGGDGKKFRPPVFGGSVARSGWSWGTTSFDLSNNGYTDIYVANGNLSGESCKDYCTKFWTRDIYLGNSRPNPALQVFFDEESERTRGQSWNGYEKNAFFLNEGGKDYMNAGFLMDAAFEYDSRALISDDLDGDGRMDLLVLQKIPDEGIVASLASNAGKRAKVGRLHIYLNQWEPKGNWIGVRLRDEPGRSTVGAKAFVNTSSGVRIAHWFNGDSFGSQHSNQKHFGLGDLTEVESIEVRWPDGESRTLKSPEINRYHSISARR